MQWTWSWSSTFVPRTICTRISAFSFISFYFFFFFFPARFSSRPTNLCHSHRLLITHDQTAKHVKVQRYSQSSSYTLWCSRFYFRLQNIPFDAMHAVHVVLFGSHVFSVHRYKSKRARALGHTQNRLRVPTIDACTPHRHHGARK